MDELWLLQRIQDLEKMPNRPPTHRNIWQGCYDVWHCEQDRIDAVQIPLKRMKDAINDGLIESTSVKKGKYDFEVWRLTNLGKATLEAHDKGLSVA